MIKVCHLVDELCIGGLENTILEIALNLHANYEHHVWCLKDKGIMADVIERRQIPLKVLGISGSLKPASITKLVQELKRHNFDIIHAHGAHPGTWGALGGFLARIPHRIVHCQNTYYGANPYFLGKFSLLDGCVDQYIAASEAVKKSLIRCASINPAKITVIYNSAAPRPHYTQEEKAAHRQALGIRPGTLVIGNISRLETHKGHRYLLEAIAALQPALPDIACLIVGDGEAMGALRKFTRDKNLSHMIHFAGWQKDINAFLSTIDVFVQPSTLREGLPLALAEAASAGIPMIATDIGGNAEIVTDGVDGYIIPAKNSQVLAEKIRYIYQHPEVRSSLGIRAAITWEEKFTLRAMLEKIDALYQTLEHKKSRRLSMRSGRVPLAAPQATDSDMTVSIVIPNYNGAGLLQENLPVLLRATAWLAQKEIIVVDDCSTDESVQVLREKFPQVKLLALEHNYGFSHACNAGVWLAKGRIVYLLNSDIKVSPGFLEPLIKHFQQEGTFAVSSLETQLAENPQQGTNRIPLALVRFKFGIFWYWYETLPCATGGALEQFCVSGGHAAFDRDKFIALGGFDPLFSPFYAEDGDICWRAWQRGWRSLLEPASLVQHDCKGTIGKYYTKSAILAIHWKNRFLLTWKNIATGNYMLRHLFFLFPELLAMPLCGKKEFTLGFFRACAQLPELIRSKKKNRITNPAYSNAELFARFRKERYLALETARIKTREKLSVALIVRNEEHKIKECLKRLAWADEIIVVDQSSLDRTREIAGEYTDKVYVVPAQKTIDAHHMYLATLCAHEWVLLLDADEWVTPELAQEIRAILQNPKEYTSFYLKRESCFLGECLKAGGRHPCHPIKLFKKGDGFFPAAMRQNGHAAGNNIGRLRHKILHCISSNLGQHMEELDRFTTDSAGQAYKKGRRITSLNCAYLFILKPSICFFENFFLRLGFLDGYRGLILAFSLAAASFVHAIKIWEIQRTLADTLSMRKTARTSSCRTAPEPHNSQYKEALATYHFAQPFLQDKVVLDAGCAFGYGAAFIAKTAKKVVGVDFDHDTLAWASRHTAGRSVAYLECDLRHAALKTDTFETICLFETLSAVRDYQELIQEMHRLLKTRGTFLLSARRTQNAQMQEKPCAQTTFTPEELWHYLAKAGFTVKNTYALHRPAQTYQLESQLSRIRKLDRLDIHRLLPRPLVSFGVYLLSKYRGITPPQQLKDSDFLMSEDLSALSPGLLLVCEKHE